MFRRSNKDDGRSKQGSLFSVLPNVDSNDKGGGSIDVSSLKVIKEIVKGNKAKYDSRNNDIDDYKYQSPKPPEQKSFNSNNGSGVRGPRPVYDTTTSSSGYSPMSFQYQDSRFQEQKQNDDYARNNNKKSSSNIYSNSKGSKSGYSPRSSSSSVNKKVKLKTSVDFDINSNLTTMIAAWKIKYFVTLIQKKTIKLESQKQIRLLTRELDKRTSQLKTIDNKYATEKNALLLELDKHIEHEAEINKELGELRRHHDDFRNHNSELVSLVQKIDNKKIDEKNMDLQDLIDSYKREIQVQIEQVGKLNIYKDLHEREVSKNEVLKTELEVTRKTCQELIFKLSSNEVELDVRRMSESQKEKELNKEINNLKGIIKLQEKEIQDNYERIEGLEKALIDFRDGIEITVRDLKQNFKTELGNKQDEVVGLMQQVEAMKLEKERENANMVGSLAQQIAEMQVKEREIARDLTNVFDVERKELLAKISAANVETLEVKHEKEELEKMIGEMNKLLMIKDDDIKNLKKQHNQLMKDKVVVQEIIETIAGKARSFETEKDTLKEDVEKLHRNVGKGEVMIQSLKDSIAALEKRLQSTSMSLERSYMTNEDNEENLRTTRTALVNTTGYCRFIEEQLFMARKGGEVIGVISSKASSDKLKSTQGSRSFIDSFGFSASNVIDENQESAFSQFSPAAIKLQEKKSPVKNVENISTLENRLSNLIATLEDKLYSGNNDDGNYSNFVDIANTVPKAADSNGASVDDNSKQIKREAKEKVENIRLELNHDVNLCLENIDEVYSLSKKRDKIRNQLLQWEKDFFGLCGRHPDTADKKRSNIFSSICTEFMQIQRVARDKYEEAKMLLAQVEDVYFQFDEARGVVEKLTGKRPDDFTYRIVLPNENLIAIENPYLNRKSDDDKNDNASFMIEEKKSIAEEKKVERPTNNNRVARRSTIAGPSKQADILNRVAAFKNNDAKAVQASPKKAENVDFVKVTDEISKVTGEIKEFETFLLKINKDIDLLNQEEKSTNARVTEWIVNFKKLNNNQEPNNKDKKGVAVFDDQFKIKNRLKELNKQRDSTISFLDNSKLSLKSLNQRFERR